MNGCSRGSLGSRLQGMIANFYRRTTQGQTALLVLAIGGIFSFTFAQTPVTNGYRDFNFGSTVVSTPTAEKPESKLWWNDGYWWGSLWSPSANKYRIHRFEVAAQSWIEVGPDIDDRSHTLGDALWDGQKLYVVSHVYNSGGSQSSSNTTAANSARLYRYSYDAATETYTLDAGFPVLVNSATSETLVLEKDSTGQLWVTWTQANKVYVNRSLGDDLTWGTPLVIPTQGANLSSDDISTLIAFNGKIGVLWSNQSDKKVYFAVHHDNKADTDWELRETALEDPNLAAVADDHLNLKMTTDGGGNLYIAGKTSLSNSTDPSIYLLKRSFGGGWTSYVVATHADGYTRPLVIIDDENRELYVFANASGGIYKKKTSLSNINFPTGVGEAFIKSSSDKDINNPTAAKQNVNSTTGLLVLASDAGSHNYLHNYINLASSSGAPTISSFSPTSGLEGATVTITGDNFNGATEVAFNGTSTGFTVNSNTKITATVPVGATTGKISVAKSGNAAFSASNFTVTTPATQYTLTANNTGSGNVTLSPSGGVYDAGTVVTLTETPASGWIFSGWSGDLTGSANPATITMDANKNFTATFAPSNTGGGTQVAFEESQTGSSSKSTTVATSTNLIGVSGHLYLAAISTKDNVAVTGVSGLGLSWTLVQAQCSGRSNTGVEVWRAQGTPSGNGAVTATLAAKASYAVIAVTRYSGVDAVNPLGNMVSGNTNGVNGACSGGSDNKSYSFNFTTATTGAMVYGAAAMRDRSHTPGAGYTERAEIKKSSASVAVQDKGIAAAGPVILNGTFSGSADWAVVGLEIKPSSEVVVTQYTLATNVVGSGSVNPSSGTYNAGTMVTLTATPAAGYQFSGWSGDLPGSANPATLTMDSHKNVTATFTAIPWSGPIVYEESQTGGSSGSVTVATSANLTGASGNLYLAAISSRPRKLVQSVTGLGLNWTLVKSICSGNNSTTGMDVWMAQGTPSGNGTVTATFGSAPSTAVIAVSRYSGIAAMDPVGNVIAGNVNGLEGSCTGGADGEAYSFNLATTVNDAVIFGAVGLKARIHTPGNGYIERLEFQHQHAVNPIGVAVEDKSVASASTVTVNGSFDGPVDWALVALVIKPQGAQHTLAVNTVGSGSVALNPPGGTYNVGTEVTLTATPDAGYQFSGWSGDLSGSTNPATLTMNSHKNVTATFTAIPWSGPIVYEESQTGGSSGSVAVTTSANLTSASGNLYLAAISSRPRKLVQSVSGLGLNWTLVKSICSGNNSTTGMDVWMAQGTPSGNGTVTATFGSAPSTAVIAVSRYSGIAAADPVGNVSAGNVNGLDGACSGGVDGSSYSFNLTTTVNDAVIYGAVALKARTHTPGAGYAERLEFQYPHAVNPISVAVEGKSVASASTVTVNGSFDGPVDWAVVALVIKPQGAQHTLTVNTVGSGSVALNPPGGTYNVGTEVTLTATPDAGYQFSGWSGDLTGSTNPATITMNSHKNVTATFTAIPWSGPIVYEESQTGGSSGSVTVATSANLTGVSGNLYLAAISSRPRKLVQSVSGLGLTWTLVKSICSGNNSTTGMDVWMAQGTPSGNGVVTAMFWSAPSTAVIAVSRYSGVAAANPIGNVIGGNTNGLEGSCSGGVDGNSYSFNLTTTVNDAVIYGAVALKARTHTPGAGYAERLEFQYPHAVNPIGVAVEGKSVASASTVTVNGSFDGPVDWAVVAVEIKPQGAVSKRSEVTVNENVAIPSAFQLEQNYPNPFNPGTSIRYSLPQAGEARLTIYNIYGQTVSVPVKSFQSAGTYTFAWQAVDAQGQALPSGVYFYRLEAGSNVVTRRMTLLR
jgi:uncharacterized repeat protein (TIGR02543 family)